MDATEATVNATELYKATHKAAYFFFKAGRGDAYSLFVAIKDALFAAYGNEIQAAIHR